MDDLISRELALKESYKIVIEGEVFDVVQVESLLGLPSVEPEWKWIPVTESLPEDGERVLITHKSGVSFGWYNGSYWERGAPTNHRPLQTVIAWMPLPEPYRGE